MKFLPKNKEYVHLKLGSIALLITYIYPLKVKEKLYFTYFEKGTQLHAIISPKVLE